MEGNFCLTFSFQYLRFVIYFILDFKFFFGKLTYKYPNKTIDKIGSNRYYNYYAVCYQLSSFILVHFLTEKLRTYIHILYKLETKTN